MKRIEATQRDVDEKALLLKAPLDGHYDKVIDEPCLVYEGGELVMALCDAGPEADELLRALRRVAYRTTYRTGGLKTCSRVMGFQPRVTVRRDYCSAASLVREDPATHSTLVRWAGNASENYRALNPERWARHEAVMVERVRPEWRIPGGVFTSGICNQNNPLRYHFDAGNFPDVWSCMYGFQHDIAGGHLIVPRYGLAFSFSRPRMITFDGQGLLHGVSPMRKQSPRAFRYTIVYYSLLQMCNCLSPVDELKRIQQVKTGREHKRVRREEPKP